MSDINDFMTKKFNTDVGVQATVQRETAQNEQATKANKQLRELGAKLNPIPGLKYAGSAAVHAYYSEILGQIFFISQTDTLQDCPELIAAKSFEDLRGSMMEFYSRKRQVKRSGF